MDHVVPVSKGGETNYYNLVTACDECNIGKSATELPESAIRRIRDHIRSAGKARNRELLEKVPEISRDVLANQDPEYVWRAYCDMFADPFDPDQADTWLATLRETLERLAGKPVQLEDDDCDQDHGEAH